MAEQEPTVLEGQICPMCQNKTLTLTEDEKEIPFFGKVAVFSMSCASCQYHKADVEALENHGPMKYTLDIDSEEDMKIRIVRGSEATVKLPHITTITPGPASNGYVTNVEGILKRVAREIENAKEFEDDEDIKKKAKSLLKKITRITWGQEKQRLIIEDPTGNSAIISPKAVKSKL